MIPNALIPCSATRFAIPCAVSCVLLAFSFASAQEVDFDIDPQATDQTLLEIAEVGEVQIVFVPDAVEQSESPEVRGSQSVQSAIETSLDTTELVYEFKARNFVVVKPENATAPQPMAVVQNTGAEPVLLAQLQPSEEPGEPSGGATASDTEAPSPDPDLRPVDEIVVTGTRLRDSSPTSPVQVFTMTDMERMGINSVEGLVRALPQNYAGHTQTSAIDNSSSVGTLGVATANLRGLGSDGTLVLINGRRTASTPTIQGSNINLNSIPFSAIERVEVLTDGAAAIYGGDAVAGVINFILRQGYDAEEKLALRYTSGAHGGNSMYVAPSFGVGWGSGSLSGSLRIESIEPVVAAKTGFTTLDYRSLGGSDQRSPPGPFHPLIIRNALTFQPLGGVDPSRDGTVPVTLADISMANLAPWDSVPTHLTDERESTTAFVSIEQRLAESVDGYVEFNYASYESYAERGGIFARNAFVPPSNAFNNTGVPLIAGYRFQTETERGLIEPSTNQSATDSYGVVLGVIADLPFRNWQVDSFVKYAQEEAWIRAFDGPGATELAARLADSNPATALNLFGDGSQQTEAAVANLFEVSTHPWSLPTTDTNDTTQYSISANGNLFSLPGGNIAGVLGYDYRKDSRTFSGYLATTLLETSPEREVNALYSEVMIPIVGDGNSMLGIYALEFRAAARWEEYVINGPFGGVGSSNEQREFAETSPSIGIAWHLAPGLKIRANAGDTFKAPRLDQLFGAPDPRVTFFSTIIPGYLARAGVFVDPETGSPFGVYPTNFGGNPDLKPEVSDTLTVGFDYAPEGILNGLRISATYSEIDTQQVVASTSSVLFDVAEAFVGVAAGRDASGNIVQWNLFPVNFSLETARAADLDVSYDFDPDWGHVQLGASGTYTYERSLTFLPGAEAVESQETLNGPDRLKYRAWFAWSNGPWAATLNMNHSSDYENNISRVQDRVDAYTWFDLTGSYEFGEGWRLDGGIRNLTDADFPFVDQRQPFDPRRVDIMGRTTYLEVSKSLDLL